MVSLPLSESLYGVQLLTIPLILSCILVKFLLRCLNWLSMSNPSMVKLSDQVIPRSGQMMSVGSLSLPISVLDVWRYSVHYVLVGQRGGSSQLVESVKYGLCCIPCPKD